MLAVVISSKGQNHTVVKSMGSGIRLLGLKSLCYLPAVHLWESCVNLYGSVFSCVKYG